MKHINCLLILILLILFFITLCRYYQKEIREKFGIEKTKDDYDKKARSSQIVRKVVTPRLTPTRGY